MKKNDKILMATLKNSPLMALHLLLLHHLHSRPFHCVCLWMGEWLVVGWIPGWLYAVATDGWHKVSFCSVVPVTVRHLHHFQPGWLR